MFSDFLFRTCLKKVLIRVRYSVNWVTLYLRERWRKEGRQSPRSDEKSGSSCMSQTSHYYDNDIYSKSLQDISLLGKVLLAPTQALLPCSNDSIFKWSLSIFNWVFLPLRAILTGIVLGLSCQPLILSLGHSTFGRRYGVGSYSGPKICWTTVRLV